MNSSITSISNAHYQMFRDGLMSEDELNWLEWCAKVEKQWMRSLPKFSPSFLTETFPEMKAKLKRSLKLKAYDESIPFEERTKAIHDLKSIDNKLEINDSMIARAKEYNVSDLVHKNVRQTIPCYWCPSSDALTIYPHAVKCYSCGKWADVITLYQRINNVSFISAVKAMQ